MTIQTYHRPETVAEALQLLNRSGDIAILAGGTTLVASSASEVVDLQRLPLNEIKASASSVTIGAMVRLQALVDSADLPAPLRLIAQLEEVNTFRNAGTLGGLVARAERESELYAALLVFDAQLQYEDSAGTHSMPLSAYRRGNVGKGIITAVTIQTSGNIAHERVARTPSDKPIVAIVGRKQNNTVTLAACGVADTPILIDDDKLDMLTPPSDFRGSQNYRLQMVSVLSERVMTELQGAQR